MSGGQHSAALIDGMSVKARLMPAVGDLAGLELHCAHARFVFNLGLEQRSMWRPGLRSPGLNEQTRQLAQARAVFPWLAAGSSTVQQQALRDLDRAYTRFFTGRARYPRFRRRGTDEGFAVRDLQVRRLSARKGEVHIPKVGWVRFIAHRTWDRYTCATSARVTLRNGAWHISFTTPPPQKIVARTGAVVGIDRGVANTLATSDGQMIHLPGLTAGEQTRYLALQRRLARQTRAAKKTQRPLREAANRARTLTALAKLRARLGNRRTDAVEQATTALARTYDKVAVEALNTRSMVKRPAPKPDPDVPGTFLPNRSRAKAALNRLIHASRWGQIQRRLTDKMPVGHLVTVNPAYTSRTCHACGHQEANNRESQAVFVCRSCGHTAHADTNAARNILARALHHQPGDTGGSGASASTRSRTNQPCTGKRVAA